ncbi:YncE family protein [Streptomyces sp. NPDC097619]|uniref:YncE family protein n=1 Tax=Streptomyces sp. NPDC097619 TaxID=3157228 RepID=UPI003322A789
MTDEHLRNDPTNDPEGDPKSGPGNDASGGVARGPSGDVLAVASQSGAAVHFFDAADHRRLGAVEVPGQPHELCFDPVRRRLYATLTYRSGYYHAHSGQAHELAVIDPDRRRLLDLVDLSPEVAPHGITLDGSGELLWISVEGAGHGPGGDTADGALVALDAETLEPVRRVPVGAPGPHWFALAPDGSRAYSANKEAPFLSAVGTGPAGAAGTVRFPVAGGSEGIAVSRDGRYLYAAGPKADFRAVGPAPDAGVRVLDAVTGEVVRTHRTEGFVFPVHVTVGGLVLAGELRMLAGGPGLGAQAPGLLHVYGEDGTERGSVEVGAFPLTVTSSPDGRYGYVAAVSAGTVTVVDLRAGTGRPSVVATLEVESAGEAGAHGLAYVTAPPR